SPRAKHDSSASATAWSSTSPSECASGPRGLPGTVTPPRINGRPATRRWESRPWPTRYSSVMRGRYQGSVAYVLRARGRPDARETMTREPHARHRPTGGGHDDLGHDLRRHQGGPRYHLCATATGVALHAGGTAAGVGRLG